jgi:hypothetical protein
VQPRQCRDDARNSGPTKQSTPPDIIRRLQEYQRGYADGLAERRSD